MSSLTRKIAEAIDEHGSVEAYFAWLDRKPSVKIPMSRPIPPPPPPPSGRLIREGGAPEKTIFKPQILKIMDYKIIKVEDLEIELLIRRDVTDENMPCVILTFFDTDSDNEEYQPQELIEFESISSAQNFVRDYSPASAREFVEASLREPAN